MLEIDTSGVPAFTSWLDAEVVRVELELRQLYRAWAVKIFSTIVELSPQWSGNLAANWFIEANHATATPQWIAGPPHAQNGVTRGPPLYSRGMAPATDISMARAAAAPIFSLRDTVYIHNPVDYADEVENDTSTPRIRPINRIPRSEVGKVAMVHHAAARFAVEPFNV